VQSSTTRKFSILLVVILVILTIQAWTGDTVAIFSSPAGASGFFAAVASGGAALVWHASEGILLSILAVVAFALSLVWSESRAVRIASGLGLLFVFIAAVGGFLFVMSGFTAGGNSSQMGTGFLGSYASYFIALYYARSLKVRFDSEEHTPVVDGDMKGGAN
jgi:hypothetical protein